MINNSLLFLMTAGLTFFSHFASDLVAQPNARDISGLVLDAKTNQPLAAANVFIANSTMGDASDDEGRFVIRNVPFANIELVVSVIGYEIEKRQMRIDETVGQITFRLTPKAIEAPPIEVSAESTRRWRKNLVKFTELFLGTSINAEECKLINPEVLDFQEGSDARPFTATAREPLQIENRALGYNLSLLLEKFESQKGEVTYIVTSKFDLMQPRNREEEQKWRQNRIRTYNGSRRHFLKALFMNRVKQEGFLIRNLKSPTFGETAMQLQTPTRSTLLSRAKDPDELLLSFSDLLEVTYVPELEEDAYIDFRLQHDFTLVTTTQGIRDRAKEPLNQTSWVELERLSVTVDRYGHVDDPLALKTNGYWAWERVAEMLPWEYEGSMRNRPVTAMLFDFGDTLPRKYRFTISGFLGFSSSGPARDIEDLMVSRGFNEKTSRDFPFSVTGLDTESGASWLVEAHYSAWRSLGAAVVRSSIRFGATHGKQAATEIDINYSVTSWALLATFQPIKVLRIGIGPAWYSPKSGSSRRNMSNDAPDQTNFGYAIDFTLFVPVTRSFSGQFKLQYRHVGQVELGPYRRFGSLLTDDLPAIHGAFNHWFFALGFGVGF
ncbi:carboxypeptidase-like regulatory domain-containing protein [bacterium]|nr:carboxypeptidase-like regulatory domain-containing protein [bacterium]